MTEQEKDKFLSEGRPRLTFKGIFHAFLVVLTWILFVYWWNQVIPQITVEDASMAFLVIFLTVLATSVFTLLWVRHNIGIFRRKGPRKNLPAVSEHRENDYLGRSLEHPGYDFLKRSPVVIVSLEGDKKKIQPPQDLMVRPG